MEEKNNNKLRLAFDHTDVISSISNGQRHGVNMNFNTVDNHGFLERRKTTADYSAAETCHFQKQLLVFHTAEHVYLLTSLHTHTSHS